MRAFCATAVLSLLLASWTDATAQTLRIDSAKSHATIHVGKSGILSFAAGHTHEVDAPIAEGTVELDLKDLPRSRVRLTIKSPALEVLTANEPPDDVPKVQEAMQSDKVLSASRYPTIAFQSTLVTVTSRDGSSVEAAMTGRLTIRGVTRSLTTPVHLNITTDAVTATGKFTIKQTDYGIKPITIAGVVAVKDELDVSFTIVAHQ